MAVPAFPGEISAKNHLCILFQVIRERTQLIFCPSFFFLFPWIWHNMLMLHMLRNWLGKETNYNLMRWEKGRNSVPSCLQNALSLPSSITVQLFSGKLCRRAHLPWCLVCHTYLEVTCSNGECRDLPWAPGSVHVLEERGPPRRTVQEISLAPDPWYPGDWTESFLLNVAGIWMSPYEINGDQTPCSLNQHSLVNFNVISLIFSRNFSPEKYFLIYMDQGQNKIFFVPQIRPWRNMKEMKGKDWITVFCNE